eukprot:scaffold31448_cov87-Cyclotella_meneghiniana.AAC.4
MKVNLSANNTQELIFSYTIPPNQHYEYELLKKDCSTKIGGNLITSYQNITEPIGLIGYGNYIPIVLTLFNDINITAIPSSPIWNETFQQMEICLVVSLFEPETEADPKMILSQDKHVFTIGINSTVDFNPSSIYGLQDSAAGEDFNTANLDDYVKACKCTEDETFVCDSTPLAPSEVFHVCVKSSSFDVGIRDVTQMNIYQGDQSLTVVDGGQIKYSSFSSKNSYTDQNGYKINVLLPINLFNFTGSNVTVEGTIEMLFGGGSPAFRKLAYGNGPKASPFKLEIALTNTPVASEINDPVEEDSAPPGYLVPLLAVFSSVFLLAMAGMAMVFSSRRVKELERKFARS